MLSSNLCRLSHKILITSSTNPHLNLAKELDLLYMPPSPEKTLYLWRNAPVVVIGKHQNPYKECNLKFMKDHDITLARRPTGGGAVYQDLGNTCWTFLDPKFNPSKNNEIIVSALASLNIKANATGRNDFEVDGRKISGAAFRMTADRSIHHGTMIMNVNIDNMSKSLSVDTKKLQAKGVDSVRSRVVNICELDPRVSHEKFCSAIIDSYQRINGKCEITEVDFDHMMREASVKRRYDQLSSQHWLFGRAASAAMTVSKRFPFGGFEVHIYIKQGSYDGCKVHSDCLFNEAVEKFEDFVDSAFLSQKGEQELINSFIESLHTKEEKGIAQELSSWFQGERSRIVVCSPQHQ